MSYANFVLSSCRTGCDWQTVAMLPWSLKSSEDMHAKSTEECMEDNATVSGECITRSSSHNFAPEEWREPKLSSQKNKDTSCTQKLHGQVLCQLLAVKTLHHGMLLLSLVYAPLKGCKIEHGSLWLIKRR